MLPHACVTLRDTSTADRKQPTANRDLKSNAQPACQAARAPGQCVDRVRRNAWQLPPECIGKGHRADAASSSSRGASLCLVASSNHEAIFRKHFTRPRGSTTPPCPGFRHPTSAESRWLECRRAGRGRETWRRGGRGQGSGWQGDGREDQG